MRAQSPPPHPSAEGRVRPQESGLTAQLARIVDGFGRLLSQHLELARLELADEAKAVGTSAAKILAFVPFVLVGYVLLCVALSVLLEQRLGTGAGYAIVGGVNLVGGALGVWLAVRAMQRRPPALSATRDALRESADVLSNKPSTAGELPDGV